MARFTAARCGFQLSLALACGLAVPAAGQGPVLVKDIAQGPSDDPSSSYASLPVRFRGRDYFAAADGFLGRELWSTDGTEQGIRLVADLCPGRCSGVPQALTVSGDFLYFTAANSPYGTNSDWLWRSDGTAAGTIPLADLCDQNLSGLASFLAPFQGGVVFHVYERQRQGWSLWRSDGTRAGTRPITPLPGFDDPSRFAPENFDWPRVEDDPGKHYFTWQETLWATDGTAAGTGPVPTPIRPCATSGRDYVRFGHRVVYSGGDGQRCEPWVSDGTAGGTLRLRPIMTGISSYPLSSSFVVAGERVYFTAYEGDGSLRLWKTDGTPGGTVRVRAPGVSELGQASIVAASGSTLYFVANDGEHGRELWRTDGDPPSTTLVADLSPGRHDTEFVFGPGLSVGRQVFFNALPRGASRVSLFRTRGEPNTTRRLVELGAENPFELRGVDFTLVGGRLYFAGYLGEAGYVLGRSDGTVAGTQVFDLARSGKSSNPHQMVGGTGGLVLMADDGEHGIDIWRSGGREENTEPLADLAEGRPDFDAVQLYPGLGGAFYVNSRNDRFGWTDGRTIREFHKRISIPLGFVDLGDRMLFFATPATPATSEQFWIWSSDGTLEGTARVARATDLPGYFNSFRVDAVRIEGSDEVRYLVQSHFSDSFLTSDLSVTDGTAAGTHGLARFPVGPSEVLSGLVAVGPNVFASLIDTGGPTRGFLRVSDGTEAGTREVYASSGTFSLVEWLTRVGRQVFFVGDDPQRGRELWVSDGTPEGTRRVIDIAPGPASSSPTWLTAWGDRVLFAADDGRHGLELWISDGTERGTRRIDIHRGLKGSYPNSIRVLGDRAVFAADDGVHGSELWVTDGTPEGTHLAADVMPGPVSSSPSDLAVVGDELFFNAGRLTEGYELWKLPLSTLR